MNNLLNEIKAIKKSLGNKVIIPAHHYEDPQIVKLADSVGDSYKLAIDCTRTSAEFIVFCGVRFMAEGAYILAKSDQKVIMPDTTSGCPMADLIDGKKAEKVYKKITKICGKEIAPVVYINSYSDMKSFCGKHAGSVCTSSNAQKIIKHFLDEGKVVFFAPDFNLGINTAQKLGLTLEEIVKVNRDLEMEFHGGSEAAKIFIWDGYCYVHKEFTVKDINILREEYPKINIIVHPECDEEVVQHSNLSGSTQYIYDTIKNAPPGTVWGVGTEYNFVRRIRDEFSDKKIIPLKESICVDMVKITTEKLYHTLCFIQAFISGNGTLRGEIKVPEFERENSARALRKMIDIVEG